MNLIDEDKNVLNEIQGKLEGIKIEIEIEEKFYIEFEDLINEICEMGINPIQLFNNPYIKKERNQKNIVFTVNLCF